MIMGLDAFLKGKLANLDPEFNISLLVNTLATG